MRGGSILCYFNISYSSFLCLEHWFERPFILVGRRGRRGVRCELMKVNDLLYVRSKSFSNKFSVLTAFSVCSLFFITPWNIVTIITEYPMVFRTPWNKQMFQLVVAPRQEICFKFFLGKFILKGRFRIEFAHQCSSQQQSWHGKEEKIERSRTDEPTKIKGWEIDSF